MADINFDVNEDPDAFLRSVRVSPEKYNLSASGSLPGDSEYTAEINPRDRTARLSASKEVGPANVTASIKRDMLNKENTSKIRGDMGNAYLEAENNPYSRELRGGYQTPMMGGTLRAGVNRSSPFGGKPEWSGNINYEKRFIHGGSVNHGLASLGRHGDSMLVHMNPKEVMGLQQLAMAHGKSMSINPKTGYPEAFDLTSLLPTAAAILGNMYGGPIGGAIAGGLTGAMTSKGNPLMSGMMGAFAGWGTGGVTDALQGMGDTASTEAMKSLGENAAGAANTASEQAIANETARRAADTSRITNENAANFFGRESAYTSPAKTPEQFYGGTESSFQSPAVAMPGQIVPDAIPYPTYDQTLQQIGDSARDAASKPIIEAGMQNLPEAGWKGGLGQLGTGKGWKDLVTKGGGLGLFAAASPIVSELMKPKAAPVPAATPAQFYNAKFNQTVNPNRGPNQPYFSEQNFTGEYSPTFRGAAGGEVPSANYYTNLLGGTQQQQIPSVDIRPYLDSMKYQPQQVNTPSNTPSGIPTLDASGGRWEFNPITKQYQYIPAAPAVDQNQGIRNVATGEGGMGPSEAPGFSEPTAGVSSDMAQGGLAGLHHQTNTYAAGGRLLRGPGDGMSDSIPAVIKGARPQRAALADGEFVVPADVVSHLGNGSTEAGSKHLYKMMDRIRKARTGNPKQGKQINANKFLPA